LPRMLELRGIRKSFGGVDAVKPLQFSIQTGEFFSLLGPSGCGKTTLLRMIGGLETPSQGEIHLDGARIDHLPANQRQFNLVFQRYALFPHLNIWENVAFGLQVKGIKGKDLANRVDEALSLVQMQRFADRNIETLSGGQQQRVALARALINRPKVLLLDEPLSALDLKLRQQMQIELRALQRRLGNTFIFVTHDQEEALTLSDRIAVMNQGVVEQVGTPQEIYEYPKSLFVASFIGSMNFFDAEVKEVKPESVEVSGAGVSRRPMVIKPPRDGMRPLPSVTAGEKVHVLVRPEKMKVLKSSPGPEQNYIEGVLRDSLYLGPTTQFFVQPKDANLPQIQIVQPNTAMTARKTFAQGERVFVAWSPEDCLVISAQPQQPNQVPATGATEVAVVSSASASTMTPQTGH
jgi:spermidine/putrescine transport system ATP-binding protein